jgi:hypothetical protein
MGERGLGLERLQDDLGDQVTGCESVGWLYTALVPIPGRVWVAENLTGEVLASQGRFHRAAPGLGEFGRSVPVVFPGDDKDRKIY